MACVMDQLLADYMRVINAKDDEIHRYIKLAEGLRVEHRVNDVQLRKKVCTLKKQLDVKEEAMRGQQSQLQEQACALARLSQSLAEAKQQLDSAKAEGRAQQGVYDERTTQIKTEAAKQLQLCRESAEARVRRSEQRYRRTRRQLACFRHRCRRCAAALRLCRQQQQKQQQQQWQVEQERQQEKFVHDCARQEDWLRREVDWRALFLRERTLHIEAGTRQGRVVARLHRRCERLTRRKANATCRVRELEGVMSRMAVCRRCGACADVGGDEVRGNLTCARRNSNGLTTKNDMPTLLQQEQQHKYEVHTQNEKTQLDECQQEGQHLVEHEPLSARCDVSPSSRLAAPPLRHNREQATHHHNHSTTGNTKSGCTQPDTTHCTCSAVVTNRTLARQRSLTEPLLQRCAKVMAIVSAYEREARPWRHRRVARRMLRCNFLHIRRRHAINKSRIDGKMNEGCRQCAVGQAVENASDIDSAAAALCAHGDAVELEAQHTVASVVGSHTRARSEAAAAAGMFVPGVEVSAAARESAPISTEQALATATTTTTAAAATTRGIAAVSADYRVSSATQWARGDEPHAAARDAELPFAEDAGAETVAERVSLRVRYRREKEKLLSRERAVAECWTAMTAWLSHALLAARVDMYRSMLLLWADVMRGVNAAARQKVRLLSSSSHGGKAEENAMSANSVNDAASHAVQNGEHGPTVIPYSDIYPMKHQHGNICSLITTRNMSNSINNDDAYDSNTNDSSRAYDYVEGCVNSMSTSPRSDPVVSGVCAGADTHRRGMDLECALDGLPRRLQQREDELRLAEQISRRNGEKLVELQRSVESAQHEVHRLCAHNAELRAQLMHCDTTQTTCACLTERLEQSRRDVELREKALAEKTAQLQACGVELSTWRERCANAESLRAIAEASLHECRFRERGLRFRLEAESHAE